MNENRFDPLIKKYSEKYNLPWPLVKAQVWAESSFNPDALSPCGAKGLMQLMPATAEELLTGDRRRATGDLFDPELNIELGVRYDRVQFDHFPEIPKIEERYKFMLASYNCGRGYVNQALRLARMAEFGFQPLAARPGRWQTWDFTKPFLAVPGCVVNGRRPDFEQVWDYVEKIWKKYQGYLAI